MHGLPDRSTGPTDTIHRTFPNERSEGGRWMAEPASIEASGTPVPASTPHDGPNATPPEAGFRRRSALKNALHLLYSQGMTWALAMVLTVVQPRFLGPEAQGQLRLATSIWGIGIVAINLGTNNLLTLEIAKRGVRGADMLSTVILLRLVSFVVTTVGVGAYLAAIGASRQTVTVFALVGLSTLPNAVAAVARASLLGFEHMSYVGIADVVTKVASTALALGVLLAGGGSREVSATLVVSTALNAALMWRYLRRFPGTSIRLTLDGARAVLKMSVGFLVGEAVLILYLQVDTVVLSLLVSERELGWYGTSDTLFASLLFVPTILLSSLLPVIGRKHVEDPEGLRRLVDRAFSSLVLVGVPMGLGTVVIAKPLCLLVYGERFRQTGDVLAIMGVVLIFAFCTILFGQVAIATGRQRFWNSLMAVAIATSIPLDLVFVPWMERAKGNGAMGGGLSYLVTEGMMLVAGAWVIAPQVVSRPSLVRIFKIMLAGALMFAAAWPWRDRFLAVPVLIGAVVYSAVVLALRVVTDDERQRIGAMVSRVVGRRLRRAG